MDIVVVGAGIVGASAAYHLARSGEQVTLVDDACDGRATSAGAGLISPGAATRPLTAASPFAFAAAAHYPILVRELADAGIDEVGYSVCGQLVVAITTKEAEDLSAHRETFAERSRRGVLNVGAVTDLDPSEARRLLPALGDVTAAVHLSGAARVDGARLRDALVVAARQSGARSMTGRAHLERSPYGRTRVVVDGEHVQADAVIVAAGAWSQRLLAAVGAPLRIAPQKGQILHLEVPGYDVSGWPMLTWGGAQYQLSFGAHRVVCGATFENDSGFDTRPTAGGVREVLAEQLRVCPGLAESAVAEIRVGLRPVTADSLPFIGPVPDSEDLFVCAGHGSGGLQAGPYSGMLVAALARGDSPVFDLRPFSLDRAA